MLTPALRYFSQESRQRPRRAMLTGQWEMDTPYSPISSMSRPPEKFNCGFSATRFPWPMVRSGPSRPTDSSNSTGVMRWSVTSW